MWLSDGLISISLSIILYQMASISSPEHKKLVFDGLYALDDSSADEDDPGMAESVQMMDHTILHNPTVSSLAAVRRGSLRRSLSSPVPPLQSNLSSTQSFVPGPTSAIRLLDDALQITSTVEMVKDTPVPRLRKSATFDGTKAFISSVVPLSACAPPPQSGAPLPSSDSPPPSSGAPPSSAIPRAMGKAKRKRGFEGEAPAVIKRVVDGEDIFDGLHFCTINLAIQLECN